MAAFTEILKKASNETIEHNSDSITKDPLVSVYFLCYNQVGYIEQSLKSILTQETNFSYELIIGDDCSDDGTFEIAKKIHGQHPDKVLLLESKSNLWKNLHPKGNSLRVWQKLRGKYFAFLEGDDYWTDKKKLQTQVDFLEHNMKYQGCFHQVETVFENKNSQFDHFPKLFPDINQDTEIHLHHLLHKNIFQWSSLVGRTSAIRDIPNNLLLSDPGDWAWNLHIANQGPIYGFNKCMGAYRIHDSGTWSSMEQSKKRDKSQKMLKAFLSTADFERTPDFHNLIELIARKFKCHDGAHAYRKLFQTHWKQFLRSPKRAESLSNYFLSYAWK